MRVVIADNHAPFAEGLAGWLRELGVAVDAVVSDAPSLMERVAFSPPDAVVVDVKMPFDDEGIRAAEELEATHPQVGVLVVSSYSEARWADRLFASRQRGVGYLLKDSLDDSTVLGQALRRVAGGGQWIDSRVALDHLHASIASGAGAYGGPGPTPREREVLRGMADGLSNRAIADRLRIAERTVANHINKLFAKLGLVNDHPDYDARVRAVRWLDEQERLG